MAFHHKLLYAMGICKQEVF